MKLLQENKSGEFCQSKEGFVKFKNRICLPNDVEIKTRVLEEAHRSRLTIHPSTTKMYQDLKKEFWWPGMKKDIADFVSRCLTCQRVKIEHQKPQECYSPYKYQVGSGIISLWTL